MSAGPLEERRSAARHAVEVEVVLVVTGEDGPEVHCGRSVEVAEGGCTIRLPYAPGSTRAGGVLVVRTPQGPISMLTAPITSAAGSSEMVGLRFVQAVERDDAWERFVHSVAATV